VFVIDRNPEFSFAIEQQLAGEGQSGVDRRCPIRPANSRWHFITCATTGGRRRREPRRMKSRRAFGIRALMSTEPLGIRGKVALGRHNVEA
jgi:hypothetical protein